VLLHDEGAGAHAANRELLVALGPDVIHGHIGHSGTRRPLTQEGDERLDGGRRTLRVHCNGAVVCVTHPAQDAELARSASGGLPEADALDGPADDRSDRPGAR
jgi:hypothetical protein